MNYQTALMQQILTNPKAQEIIDYVSQIYGDSYVGLWLFQTIGSVLEPVCNISNQLMQETSPATATLLLSYYENEYGIQADPSMTLAQRRAVVIANMRAKGACTPAALADAVSAVLGGVPVEIIEYIDSSVSPTVRYTEVDQIVIYGINSGQTPDPDTSVTTAEIDQIVQYWQDSGQLPDGSISVTTDEIDQIVIYGNLPERETPEKNQFIVNIRGVVKSYAQAIAVINKMKPAHLSYTIRGVTKQTISTEVTIGTALTTAEIYHVEVQ